MTLKSNVEKHGVYPGSFNPPTIAHLAVSEAAVNTHDLDRLVWSVSVRALAKESVQRPLLEHRLSVLRAVASSIEWLEIQVTELQILADIADGFDTIVMGADKWHQIHDTRWYDSEAARDAALGRLPNLAIAPRPPLDVPAQHLLDVASEHGSVSSTAARAGDLELMLPAARVFAEQTGAWIDDARYQSHLDETA